MKPQHILILFSLVAALAVALYVMRAPASPEAEVSKDPASEPIAQTPEETSADLGRAPEVAAAAPNAAASSAKVANESETASGSMPHEELRDTIKKKLNGAREVLQQKSAIEKASPEDVHHMPRETLDAARRLGEIAELEAQHPEQAESFRDFYLECARDGSTMTVTRAQCLDKYLRSSKMDTAEQKQFLSEFPEEILRLVAALQ